MNSMGIGKFCVNCGKEIPSDMKFCGYCGRERLLTSKSDSSGGVAASVSPSGKRSSTSWGLIPTIVVVAIGGYLAIVALTSIFNAIAPEFSDQISHGQLPKWPYAPIVLGITVLWRAVKKNIQRKGSTPSEIDRTQSWRKR
jgi:hypothetical protein